ncbi:MAG: aldo/keto reductase [Planctomycetota bacterium]|nr:aldo/keto reductase [Planctomycetota bacterium]
MNHLGMKRLGNHGPEVTRLALGCWATGGHGWGEVSDEDSVSTIQLAFDEGINFFDTADVYGLGHSETLLAQALGENRHDVVIASKGGLAWDESGKTQKDCSPGHLKRALEGSLRRMKLESIPLYYVHWPDGNTPISATMTALAGFRDAGLIQYIGVSNFSQDQLEEALQITYVDAIQIQMSILDRTKALGILPVCQRAGTGLVTWGSLADGLLTGKFTADSTFPGNDHRSRSSNFQPPLFLDNLRKVEIIREVAARNGVSVAQVSLRWLLETEDVSTVLFGAKNPNQLKDNLGSVGWTLSRNDYRQIESLHYN